MMILEAERSECQWLLSVSDVTLVMSGCCQQDYYDISLYDLFMIRYDELFKL